MTEEQLQQLKFPIAHPKYPEIIDDTARTKWTDTVESLPGRLVNLIDTLTEAQTNYRYRPDGWTIREVIHHLADSHSMAFSRFKLALTEDDPRINPYQEAVWAKLPDATNAPLQFSLDILRGVHGRWSVLLRHMKEADWKRTYFHPEQDRSVPLERALGLYAWHCEHHLAHIRLALEKRFS